MLTRQVISRVEPIRDELANQDITLTVKEGTPLSELVHASMDASTKVGNIDFGESDHMELLQSITSSENLEGEYEHDRVHQDIVDEIAETVEANLHLARSKVIPAAREVYDYYAREFERIQIDTSQPVYIVPNTYHEIWRSQGLSSMVERYGNAPLNPFSFPISLPELSVSEIQHYVQTGIGTFDELVGKWFDSLSAEKVLNDYRRLFITGTVSVGRPTNSQHVTADGLDRNALLLAFLVANGIEQEVPEGLENVSLDNLYLNLARMKEQSGRVVHYEIERRERDFRNRMLVYRTDYIEDNEKSYTNAYVNNDVYQKFLEENGTPESIYGAVLANEPTGYYDILDNKDANERRWQRYFAMHKQRVSSYTTYYKREAIRVAMDRYINALDENVLPDDRATLHERNRRCVHSFSSHYFDEEMVAIRDIVAHVLYPNTNAHMILASMGEAEREDPNLSARECALLATIDLVVRWIGSQIETN